MARARRRTSLLSPFALARRNGLYKGLIGGDRSWLVIGAVFWGGRALKKSLGKNEQIVAMDLQDKLEAMGLFEVIGRDAEQLPLVAFKLKEERSYNEFDIAWQLSAERGWMVPAYTLPPDAQDVTIMRALVKETMSREHVDTLARDIIDACATLEAKGGAHESERRKMVVGPGH
jgi:glutamate decarboxylase